MSGRCSSTPGMLNSVFGEFSCDRGGGWFAGFFESVCGEPRTCDGRGGCKKRSSGSAGRTRNLRGFPPGNRKTGVFHPDTVYDISLGRADASRSPRPRSCFWEIAGRRCQVELFPLTTQFFLQTAEPRNGAATRSDWAQGMLEVFFNSCQRDSLTRSTWASAKRTRRLPSAVGSGS